MAFTLALLRVAGTATDALWAAVPLLTLPLRKMASRAAASFVHASAGQVSLQYQVAFENCLNSYHDSLDSGEKR